MRNFSALQNVNSVDDKISVFELPPYLEMGFSIFKNQLDCTNIEEARWKFLLWAYEDESNLIYQYVREDPYIKRLFSVPHIIQTLNGLKVVMHKYHYWYFLRDRVKFQEWGFDDLEVNPKSYLIWFYENSNLNNFYSKYTKDNLYFKNESNVNLVSVLNLPLYIESKYLELKENFIGKKISDNQLKTENNLILSDDVNSRWRFLLWAYTSNLNEISTRCHIRNDEYVAKLFSTPREIKVSETESVFLHEYHYQYFLEHSKQFIDEWKFEPLEINPKRYLHWFYKEALSGIYYAQITKDQFNEF